jgi:hypothetical protein
MAADQITLINRFNEIKVFQVDSSDPHLKIYNVVGECAALEIYMLGNLFFVKLTSEALVEDRYTDMINSESQILLDVKLAELNVVVNSIRQCSNNSIVNHVELRPKQSEHFNKNIQKATAALSHLTIEFLQEAAFQRFDECLQYLNEIIYPEQEVYTEDAEMLNSDCGSFAPLHCDIKLDELCFQFKLATKNGNVDKACIFAAQLAELKANLIIYPENFDKKEEIKQHERVKEDLTIKGAKTKMLVFIRTRGKTKKDANNNQNMIELGIADISAYTILELKNSVLKHFSIPIDRQLVIINEFTSRSDSDTVDNYSKINGKSSLHFNVGEEERPCTSAMSAMHEKQVLATSLEFIAHVFDLDERENLIDCSDPTAGDFENDGEDDILDFFVLKKKQVTIFVSLNVISEN